MKKFYVKGTDVLARKSNRDYICAVVYVREDGSMVVYSCHSSFGAARLHIRHLLSDYSRHPMDFNLGYNPSRLSVVELEIR